MQKSIWLHQQKENDYEAIQAIIKKPFQAQN